MSIELGDEDASMIVQQGSEADVSNTIEGTNDTTALNPDLAESNVAKEVKPETAEAGKAVEKEKPMTAHERWKQRWEAKYSKMVPELVPIVITAIAMAVPSLEQLHTAIGQDPVIDTNIKFWTEQLFISGPALAALVVDRLIRRKAHEDEQKALEEDTVAVEEDDDVVVDDQPHLEKAIKEAQDQIDKYRTEQAKEINPTIQMIYSNHIIEARRSLARYQTKLNQLNGVEEDEEEEAA